MPSMLLRNPYIIKVTKKIFQKPLFSHILTLKNNCKIMACDMGIHDIDEVIELLAKSFTSYNPSYNHLKISIDDVSLYYKKIIQRSLSENMAIYAYDIETKQVVATLICYDLYNMQIKPLNLTELDPKVSEIRKMHIQLGPKFYPKKPGIIACAASTAVHSNYRGLGITHQISQKIWEEHPLLSMYPIIYAQLSSPITVKFMAPDEFRRYTVYHPKHYINEKGERPFETIDDTAKKLGLRDYEGIVIGLRENYLKEKK